MANPRTHHATHSVTIDAPAQAVYGLVSATENWPLLFPPTVLVHHIERVGTEERIQIWATANDEVKTWTSFRRLDPAARRIEFRQERSHAPVRSMGGAWTIGELPGGQTVVTLDHDFTAVDDTPENVEWIERAIDRNSGAELSALRKNAESLQDDRDLLLKFADTITVHGSASDVYQFIRQAQEWPQRLPHVSRVALDEDTPDLQLLEMDTRAPDGSVHTTRSVRVCFPDTAIVYKQLLVPKLLSAHLGRWLIERQGDDVRLTSEHTVVIEPAAIAGVLGADATVADAKNYVHTALSNNSGTTMAHARDFAEKAKATPVGH
nr:aromatase [Amycolatopsis sp.]